MPPPEEWNEIKMKVRTNGERRAYAIGYVGALKYVIRAYGDQIDPIVCVQILEMQNWQQSLLEADSEIDL